MLFVFNHDGKAQGQFAKYFRGIGRTNIPVAPGQLLHVLGPEKITDLFAVATDIRLEIQGKRINELYRFHYPDLILWKRHTADDERGGATIETLMSPYFILRYEEVRKAGELVLKKGSVVYYSRSGDTFEEFVYLLDSCKRPAIPS